MKKNVASQIVGAQVTTAADGTNFTGAVTCYYTLDGGSQTIGSVGSGACTHEGNGYHTYTPTAGETNGDHVAYTFIGTGAITSTVQGYTTFPQTVDNATNISAIKTKTDFLPSVTAGAAGGVFIAGTNAATTVTTSFTTTFTGNLTGAVDSVTGAVGSVTGAVGSVTGAVGSVTAGVTVTTNNDKTGYALGAGGIGSGVHAAAELNAIADAMLDRNMATGVDSGTDSTVTRTVRQALRALRNKVSIGGGVATVTKEDDTTASWTSAVLTTAGDPISSSDPT